MARRRDYKAEYRRRIEAGMATGLSKRQAGGHPARGEVGARQQREFNEQYEAPEISLFENPFAAMKQTLNDMLGKFNQAFSRVIEVPTRNTIDYEPGYGRILPRWTSGSEEVPIDRAGLTALYNDVRSKRPQGSYTFTVSGATEEPYPGHEDEYHITLSYRMNWRAIEEAVDNPQNRTVADVINDAIHRSGATHTWFYVDRVQFIDKD